MKDCGECLIKCNVSFRYVDEDLAAKDTVRYPYAFWLGRPIYDRDDDGDNTYYNLQPQRRTSTISYASIGSDSCKHLSKKKVTHRHQYHLQLKQPAYKKACKVEEGHEPQLVRQLTLRINRELAVAVAVRKHPRGVELPQSSLPVLLRRASEDLVVVVGVGEAQQAYHLRERQRTMSTSLGDRFRVTSDLEDPSSDVNDEVEKVGKTKDAWNAENGWVNGRNEARTKIEG
ncbi:hypothetical protein WH47_12603 [Habropoda laboriosa]|uniref:Uncharacterized protein n=1 Tax=Habropoda laboriosa TaxID=597456 RepID=A0A0L7R7I5_9HYME|nr:hypothetical protein WH47_12603 [Habropoda laboriosa]